MKSSIVLSGLAAVLASAQPVLVTDWVTDIVTVTVTVDSLPATTPTSAPARKSTFHHRPHSHSQSPSQPKPSTPPAQVKTTTIQVVPSQHQPTTAQAAPPAESSAAPSSGGGGGSTDYSQSMVDAHNQKRKLHGVGDLQWDDSLASSATQLVAECNGMHHDTTIGGGGYGQNLAGQSNGNSALDTVSGTMSMWYNEIKDYTYYGEEPSMSNFEAWGHYSQVVWKATTHVGCGTVKCPDMWMTACNYKVAGNMAGAYAANVLPPLSS